MLCTVVGLRWRTGKCCGRSGTICSTCPKHCRRFCWLLTAGIGLVSETFMQCFTCGAPWNLSVLCSCSYHGKRYSFKSKALAAVATAAASAISWPSFSYTLILLLQLLSSLTPFLCFSFSFIFSICVGGGGHTVVYWLKHYATISKVVGSRPDEVNEFT
jgi:hypothetical protein